MCRVQERQLSLLYFLSYLPLMIKAAMISILKSVRNIFMRLYGSVEEVVTLCIKNMAALEFISPSHQTS